MSQLSLVSQRSLLVSLLIDLCSHIYKRKKVFNVKSPNLPLFTEIFISGDYRPEGRYFRKLKDVNRGLNGKTSACCDPAVLAGSCGAWCGIQRCSGRMNPFLPGRKKKQTGQAHWPSLQFILLTRVRSTMCVNISTWSMETVREPPQWRIMLVIL